MSKSAGDLGPMTSSAGFDAIVAFRQMLEQHRMIVDRETSIALMHGEQIGRAILNDAHELATTSQHAYLDAIEIIEQGVVYGTELERQMRAVDEIMQIEPGEIERMRDDALAIDVSMETYPIMSRYDAHETGSRIVRGVADGMMSKTPKMNRHDRRKRQALARRRRA